MKAVLKLFMAIAVMMGPVAAHAAHKATDEIDTETSAAPPKDVTLYPCWDTMQEGHMKHMHGMMHGDIQMPPQGVTAHTCWDMMQDGRMMHMRNMHMMWNGSPSRSNQKQ